MISRFIFVKIKARGGGRVFVWWGERRREDGEGGRAPGQLRHRARGEGFSAALHVPPGKADTYTSNHGLLRNKRRYAIQKKGK